MGTSFLDGSVGRASREEFELDEMPLRLPTFLELVSSGILARNDRACPGALKAAS